MTPVVPRLKPGLGAGGGASLRTRRARAERALQRANNRGGFALLTVLWLLTALAALGLAGSGIARLGAMTTRNRVLLARAAWAREACVEILLARYAADPAVRAVPTVNLGRGTWCRSTLDDPGARVNVNLAAPAVLERLVPAPLLDSVLRRRPFAHETELGALTPDAALLARLLPLLTTRGTGTVNVNVASRDVLRALPGMGEEAVSAVLARSAAGGVRSLDELLGLLTPAARATLVALYPELIQATTFAPAQLVALVEGGVTGTALVARATLTLIPVPERLAVIRREVE